MSSIYDFCNLIWHRVYVVILISNLSLLSVNAFAANNNYQLKEVVQLEHSQHEASKWLQLAAHPTNTNQYFIINKTGQMYFVDEMAELRQVLSLQGNDDDITSSVKLTAMALHPNFALRDQLGYGTFYTAHIEPLDKNVATKRIQERDNNLTLTFDTVITEWQFHSSKYQKVNLSTKREVLRIAVPDESLMIKQMSFNPYAKSWNDGFGLLYIALNGQSTWQKPLYSGTILRINPAKFGLRSFTVPTSNPYLEKSDIADEIYLFNGQDIKHFIWPDKGSDDILLSHLYNNQPVLSLTNMNNNLRDNDATNIIYQGESMVEGVMLYRGGELPALRNHVLILTKAKNQNWFIESLNLASSVNSTDAETIEPKQEWQFTVEQLPYDSDIAVINNSDGEVLIIDKTLGNISQVFKAIAYTNLPVEQEVISVETETESSSRFYILLFILLTAIGSILFLLKRNKISAKAIVRKQFAQLELSESKQQIGLYHRHQKAVDTIINIIDIASFEVKLNGETVNSISREVDGGFNDDKEQGLRVTLNKEKIDKMIDDKIRQVTLSFTDIHTKNYVVCLYMRKGSDRVTKKAYSAVIDDLIDWCWLIATTLNPDDTGIRKKKSVIPHRQKKNIVDQKSHTASLHEQAASNRLSTYKNKQAHDISGDDVKENSDTPEPVALNNNIETVGKVQQNKVVDSVLVNALEKLVELRKQGFLTQEEFTEAKKNVLGSLSD